MPMKKVLFGLTAILSILTLAGCKPPDDIVIDDEEEKIEEGATNVKMWMMDFEEWENRINISQRKKFNSNLKDGIQLSQQYINKNDFDDLIRSAYESKNVPDIYMVSYGNLYKEIKAGRAIDLTSYFSTETWNDLTDNATQAVKYDNKYYAFPIVMEPSTIVAYSKSKLQKYGGVTNVPNNWSDFLEVCKTIKANLKAEGVKNVYPFGVPTGVACAWGTWGMQVAATGGLAITDDWSTSRITEPGYKDLANLWKELYLNTYVPLSSGEYTQSVFDIGDGKAIMTTCGSWSISSIINDYSDLKDDIGFAIMPTFDGNQDRTTATNGGWAYVISSECKNVSEAVEVIKYLTAENEELPVDYFTKAYYSKSSPRKSIQAIISTEAKKQTVVPYEWIEVVNSVSNNAILEPIYDWNISVAVEGLLEEAAMGKNIDDAITKCDSAVKKIIQDNKLAGTNPRN